MGLDILGPANAPNAVTSRPSDTRSFAALDSWFKDCTSPVANDGTKLQSGFMNAVIAQLRSLIRGNGLTAGSAQIVADNNSDDNMVLEAVQHLIQRGLPSYAADTGAADVLAIALTPVLAEYKAGLKVYVLIGHDNATTTPTLNVNGLGAKSIVYSDGAALQPADLKAGSIVPFTYDGTKFQAGLSRSAILNIQRTQVVADRGASTQIVPDSVSTRVTAYSTVNVKSNGGTTFVSGVMTVGAGDAGLWFVSFHCRQVFSSSSGFTNAIHINNSATPIMTDGANIPPSTTATAHGAGGRLLNLNAGDTVEMRLLQTSGSSITFNDLYDMTATRLGAS